MVDAKNIGAIEANGTDIGAVQTADVSPSGTGAFTAPVATTAASGIVATPVPPIGVLSGTQASTYLGTDGTPLSLRLRVSYAKGVDDREESLLSQWRLTDIIDGEAMTHRLSSSGATFLYMRPLQFSVTQETTDENYRDFRGLIVTFRFRRIPPRKEPAGGSLFEGGVNNDIPAT